MNVSVISNNRVGGGWSRAVRKSMANKLILLTHDLRDDLTQHDD